MRMVVVLPAPFGPSRPTTPPLCALRVTSRNPQRLPNTFARCSISIMARLGSVLAYDPLLCLGLIQKFPAVGVYRIGYGMRRLTELLTENPDLA